MRGGVARWRSTIEPRTRPAPDEVATGSDFPGTAGSKKVGIEELENDLSDCVREARRGARILVTDRADVVVELREPGTAHAPSGDGNPVLYAWARAASSNCRRVRSRRFLKALYVETSALLAWLLGRKRGPEARAAIDAAETVVTSAIA